MTLLKNNIERAILLVAILAVVGYAVYMGTHAGVARGASGSGDQAAACTSFTVSSSTVGAQSSTVILSAHANRAWARIQQPANATNTVGIAIGTALASSTSGIQLTPATTTSPVNSVAMGLNTELPYTGAISAATNNGSTTILVTECLY